MKYAMRSILWSLFLLVCATGCNLSGTANSTAEKDDPQKVVAFYEACFNKIGVDCKTGFENCYSESFFKNHPQLWKGLQSAQGNQQCTKRFSGAMLAILKMAKHKDNRFAVNHKIKFADGRVEADGAYWYIIEQTPNGLKITDTINDFEPTELPDWNMVPIK